MKHLFKSSVLVTTVVVATVANTAAQRGPVVPQMRGDGPPPEAKPFSITKNDPALDDIIAPSAQLVELARGFGLTEGGLWIAEGNSGYWIFAGLLDNVIYKVTPQKQVSVFMEKAGYTGNDPEHVGTQTRAGRSHVLLIGPSCTGMDRQGRVDLVRRQRSPGEAPGKGRHPDGAVQRHERSEVQRPERHRHRGGRCGVCDG